MLTNRFHASVSPERIRCNKDVDVENESSNSGMEIKLRHMLLDDLVKGKVTNNLLGTTAQVFVESNNWLRLIILKHSCLVAYGITFTRGLHICFFCSRDSAFCDGRGL